MAQKRFLKIIKELNYPPVFLIHHEQFAMLDGADKREENMVGDMVAGIASVRYPVITVHPWLEDAEMRNTIYHEIAHHLWPWKPHWWIDLFGEKMAGGGGRGYWAAKNKKKLSDLPSRRTLLQMARRQGEKLKIKYNMQNWLGGSLT